MTDQRLQELTALDEQMVDLLQKRVHLWRDLEEGGHEFSSEDAKVLISNMLEVAADYDLDEELVEKAAKVTNALCRRSE